MARSPVARFFSFVLASVGALAVVAFLSLSLAQSADPFAQARAAYDRGDFGTAREHFRVLADLGQPKAQTMMGHTYLAHRAVPTDFVIADHWYGRAAERGEPNGQLFHATLGLADDPYSQNKVPPIEVAAGIDLMRKAATQGLTEAITRLAAVLADGAVMPDAPYHQLETWPIGIARAKQHPKNDAEAAMWLAKAAAQGDSQSQELLGLRHLDGAGVSKDDSEAYFWLSVAALRPLPKNDIYCVEVDRRKFVLKYRARVKARLSGGQIASLDERVRAWRAAPQPDFGTDIYTPAERASIAEPPDFGKILCRKLD